MAVIGTFGSFTAARLGIYASQASLNVTGNNISNINTKGYTRQRADLVSLHSAGSARYASGFNLDIGYGVLVDSVSQLRDPFLDIRYRDEQASVGYYEARVKGLQQLSNILDEVGKGKGEFGIVEAQFNDFLQQLQNLNNRVNSQEYDTTVRSSAESLVKLFNTYSKALERVKENQLKDLQGDVKSVNTILTQIRDLNVQIRQAGIYGEKALELRDQRNVLIDKLSAYTKIEVQYSTEKLDEFSEVEKLSITLADSGNPPVYLINGIYGTQLTMPEMAASRNPNYDPSLPTSNRYISRESTDGKIVYTNNEREAMRNKDGVVITNDDAGEALIKQMDGFAAGIPGANMYGKGPAGTAGQYLDENGDPTDDITKAAQVENAVQGSDANRLWMRLEPLVDERGRYIKDEYNRDINEIVELGDNALFGSLQAKRELLTEEGEYASEEDLSFDSDANTKRGIPYYQRALDSLARKFAETFNEANTTECEDPNDPTKTIRGQVFLGYKTKTGIDGIERYDLDSAKCDLAKRPIAAGSDEEKVVNALKAAGISEADAEDYLLRTDLTDLPADLQSMVKNLQNRYLTEKGYGAEKYGGGILFSTSGDTDDYEGITAANISIANSWATGAVRILNTKNAGADHSTANDNIYHMISLMTKKLEYKPDDIGDIVPDAANGDKTYFEGSFQQRLADINTILSTDQQTTAIEYSSFEGTSLNLDNQRQSVSGVDLNEEATSMMMYQKSYSAACQLMTTLDSMLDKLINDTIR